MERGSPNHRQVQIRVPWFLMVDPAKNELGL